MLAGDGEASVFLDGAEVDELLDLGSVVGSRDGDCDVLSDCSTLSICDGQCEGFDEYFSLCEVVDCSVIDGVVPGHRTSSLAIGVVSDGGAQAAFGRGRWCDLNGLYVSEVNIGDGEIAGSGEVCVAFTGCTISEFFE